MAFTANEQLMLELVNRARLNPLAEAARFEISLNEGLTDAPLDGSARQPLVGNLLLHDAAVGHAAWMLAANDFDHIGEGGSSPRERMTEAGYVFTPPSASGENISWTGTTGTLQPQSAIVGQHENLFLSSGHRLNILDNGFTEIGIGQQTGVFPSGGIAFNASMVAQNFADSANQVFLTGVSYTDSNGNAFYDVNEAQAGTGFTVDGQTVQSAAAGGYSMLVAPGGLRNVTVTFDGATTEVEVDFTKGNVKLDAVGGAQNALFVTSDASLSEPIEAGSIAALRGLGIAALDLIGNSADNTLWAGAGGGTLDGGAGDDSLRGGDGLDTLIGGEGNDTIIGGDSAADLRDVVFAGAGNDSIDGGYGNDSLRGGAGNDTIEGGFGVDVLVGEAGSDVLSGSAFSDEIFGNDGFDFINGGFGFDRLNGGADGDKFFHLGIADHGSDWIQDYNAAEGDVLFYGGGLGPVAADTFVVQRANTANAGVAGIDEVFITHAGSGNLLWALVDGGAQSSINLQIDGQIFDLLA